MKKKKIKIRDVKGLLYNTDNNNTTKKEKLQIKIYELYNEISSIECRGAEWTFNLTTGECEFVPRKLSKDEEQKLNELKAELKKLEVKLKITELEKDFKNEQD